VIERSREEQVAGHGVVDERRAGAGRIDGVHDGRPRLVLHPDPRGGVLGSVAVRRDDGRERFADVAHAGRGEHGLLGLDVARQRRARANAVPGDELVTDDVLTRLDDIPSQEIERLVAALREQERHVSEVRHELHRVIDALKGELTRRYASGEASIEELLGER